jgi:hypothetical protein
MANGEYKKLFIQALDGSLNEEKNKRIANSLFLLFKALTELAKYILSQKYKINFEGKSSHSEIKLFYMTRGRQETASLLEGAYIVYVNAYEQNRTVEKVSRIKNAIKEFIKIEGIEEEFKDFLEKI